MAKYQLVSDTGAIPKLPTTSPLGQFTILRFVEPSRSWPSGKVVARSHASGRNVQLVPQAMGLALVPAPVEG